MKSSMSERILFLCFATTFFGGIWFWRNSVDLQRERDAARESLRQAERFIPEDRYFEYRIAPSKAREGVATNGVSHGY